MQQQDILKVKNIIKISPEETLSSALSYLGSSHDAAFVFSEKNDFMGVINPYHCLIKKSYPGNAHVEHCLFHAPKIRTNHPISKVAQLMIESKVHYLPVFDESNKFVGITSARHVLSKLRESQLFNLKIEEFLGLKNRPLITIYENDSVSQAIHLFKTHKISKLIVLTEDMKLKGILTHYDLISYLATPRRKGHLGDRQGNRVSFQHKQVKNFARTFVLTLPATNYLHQAMDLILEKEIGSVVIVDQEKHPIGIITTRDFLQLLAKSGKEWKFDVVAKNLSEESSRVISGFFDQLNSWVAKIPNIARAKLFVKEEKKGGVFKTVFSLIPRRGNPKVIKQEGKNLREVLKKSDSALRRMIRG